MVYGVVVVVVVVVYVVVVVLVVGFVVVVLLIVVVADVVVVVVVVDDKLGVLKVVGFDVVVDVSGLLAVVEVVVTLGWVEELSSHSRSSFSSPSLLSRQNTLLVAGSWSLSSPRQGHWSLRPRLSWSPGLRAQMSSLCHTRGHHRHDLESKERAMSSKICMT